MRADFAAAIVIGCGNGPPATAASIGRSRRVTADLNGSTRPGDDRRNAEIYVAGLSVELVPQSPSCPENRDHVAADDMVVPEVYVLFKEDFGTQLCQSRMIGREPGFLPKPQEPLS